MRQVSLIQLLAVIIVWLGVGAACAEAVPPSFEEGKQYQRAPKDITSNTAVQDFLKEADGKVQVMEVFSYGCHWCFKLDPFIEKWRKTLPSYVAFQRVPVEFQPAWGVFTKAYYTALDLNALEQVHSALFEAINTQKITDASEAILRDFFISKGIKAEDFTKTFDSFDVDRKQRWANTMTRAYRITAVPAIIVQGPSGVYISTVRMAGSEDKLLEVVDFLIKQEHEALMGARH